MVTGLLLIGGGLVILGFAWHDYHEGESDTIFLLDWDWIWFDLDRESHPVLYWVAIAAQVTAGLTAISVGVVSLLL